LKYIIKIPLYNNIITEKDLKNNRFFTKAKNIFILEEKYMNLTDKKKKTLRIALLCFFSLLAGGINGFVGTGGGIAIVYILTYLTDNDTKDNFAMTLCTILPISVVSLYAYVRSGGIDFEMIRILTPSAILGGAFGAYLTDKINKDVLSLIFAILVIYSGTCMIFR
jgi:uncharacterized membrane protein YfcA